MEKLTLVWLAFIQLARKMRLVPKNIANVFKQRRQQAAVDKREAERLDRICNPFKYRGK